MIPGIQLLSSYFMTRHGRHFRDRQHLETWQEARLQGLLTRILPRSPFYRERIASAGGAHAWGQMPPLEKTTMMEAFTRLNTVGISLEEAMSLAVEAERSRDFSPMIGNITVGLSSGTSGNRGLFLASGQERARYAGTILAKLLPGSLFERHRVAFFLRANSNLYSGSSSRFLRFEFFDLLAPIQEHLERLEELQPTLLFAPPSVLRQLAEAMSHNPMNLRPQRIFSVAEVLDPIDESYLEVRFGQRIHQVYQCTEGFLGVTCPHGTLHLNEDLVIIEKEWLDRSTRKFVPIITDFRRETQPILRYRLNDILTEREFPCPCGSVFTALESIEGRCDDILTLHPLGPGAPILVYPDFIRRAIMLASDAILDYRVIQGNTGAWNVSLHIPNAERASAEKCVLEELAGLSARLSAQVPSIHFAETIETEKGEKLRRVERRDRTP